MISDKIINYRELIDRSTQGFVGRRWVREAVDAFLVAAGPRAFLLLGEPGSGKTAFLADLARQRGYPHHFIGKGSLSGVASSADWRNPVRYAESIGYQLLRDYGGWIMDWESWGIRVEQRVRDLDGLLVGAKVGELRLQPGGAGHPLLSVSQEVERFGPAAQVVGVYVDRMIMDPEQVVRQLVTIPLQRIAERDPGRQVVLAVDGLDEAEGYSAARTNILRLLPGSETPANVRLILSSRPGTHLTNDFLSGVQTFWLSRDDRGHLPGQAVEDARDFVRHLSAEPEVGALLAASRADPEALIHRVAEASAGNFLYLYHYAQGVRRGDAALLDLASIPQGLNGIYEDFLGKIRAEKAEIGWDTAYKPVLGTLAVAREALARPQIAAFSGIEAQTVATILTRLDQFLQTSGERREKRYAIYHLSFAEYLTSEDSPDLIDRPAAHQRIAERYLDAWGGFESDLAGLQDSEQRELDAGYGLQHLMAHLEGAGRPADMHRLLGAAWRQVERKPVQQPGWRGLLDRLQGRQRYQETVTNSTNAWYTARQSQGQTDGYLFDVARAWQLAEQDVLPQRRAASPTVAGPQPPQQESDVSLQVRYALITASINSLAGNVPPELLVQLLRQGFWTPEQALAYAEQAPDAEQRAAALKQLAPYLSSELRWRLPLEIRLPPERDRGPWWLDDGRWDHWTARVMEQEEVEKILTAAREISDYFTRGPVLAAIASHLPTDLQTQVLQEALEAARTNTDSDFRAAELAAIAPYFPREEQADVWDEVISSAVDYAHILEKEHWVNILERISDKLPATERAQLWQKAVEVACEVVTDDLRGSHLAQIANHLPKDQQTHVWQEAISVAHINVSRRKDTFGCVQNTAVLARTAVHLPAAEQEQLVREILKITEDPDVSEELQRDMYLYSMRMTNRAIILLAPQLVRRGLPDQALALAGFVPRKVSNPSDPDPGWIEVLSEIAPHLPPDRQGKVLSEALDTVRGRENGGNRDEELAVLAPLLARLGHFDQALEAARAITYPTVYERLSPTLSTLALTLADAGQPRRAIEAARSIPDETIRVRSLVLLAARLVELGHMPEAWVAARDISTSCLPSRAWGNPDAPAPEDGFAPVADEILRAVKLLPNPDARKEALAALASHLSITQISRLWQIAQIIGDQDDLAEAANLFGSQAARVSGSSSGASDAQHAVDSIWGPMVTWQQESLSSIALTMRAGCYGSQFSPEMGEIWEVERWTEALATARVAAGSDTSSGHLCRELLPILPHLPEDERQPVVEEALTSARAMHDDSPLKASALLDLVPYLPAEHRLSVTEEVWKAESKSRPGFYGWSGKLQATDDFVYRLVALGYPDRALAIAQTNGDSDWHTLLLVYLAFLLLDRGYDELAAQAARMIGYSVQRDDINLVVAVRLAKRGREALALDALRAIENTRTRMEATIFVAPHVDKAQRVGLLRDALHEASAESFGKWRIRALTALAPQLAALPRPILLDLRRGTLAVLARRTRRELLADLRALIPVIASLGSATTMAEVAQAIEDVGYWWS